MNKILSSTSLSLATALFLFTGCGGDASTQSSPAAAQISNEKQEIVQQQTLTIKAKADRVVVNEGETINFGLSAYSNDISSVEWKSTDGKLLSTNSKFNRLFQNEGNYEVVLTITDKKENVTSDTISIKVNRNQVTVIEEIPNKAPIIRAVAESLEIMDGDFIHLSDNGSYDIDGTIVKYEWRDMEGILLSETKKLNRRMFYYPQFDFNDSGITRYVKTLFITDNKGKTSSKSFEIIVKKNPDSDQNPDDGGDNSANYQLQERLGTFTTTTYTYDANGNIETANYDDDNDGTIDSIDTFTYDASGKLLIESYDEDADGTADNIFTYTYDTNGNKISTTYDFDADGTADSIDSYTYNVNGKISTESYDGNADGTIDSLFTYIYDGNGDLSTINYDDDNDGIIDNVDTFTYDASGNKLTTNYDYGNNGIIDTINTFTYNTNGNKLTESYDDNNDGTIDRIDTFTYDTNGNLSTEAYDYDADGMDDEFFTYTWIEI